MKYCFDTVEVMITASDDITSSSLSHVLVPILSETEVSVVLEPGLEEDTHFTATLSFNSQQITTTTFCESPPSQSVDLSVCGLVHLHVCGVELFDAEIKDFNNEEMLHSCSE